MIEVDGDKHFAPKQMDYDAARTAWLEEQGLRVARVTNDEVMENLDAVLEWIAKGCVPSHPGLRKLWPACRP